MRLQPQRSGAHPVEVFQGLGVRGSPLPPAEAQRGDDVCHLPHGLQQGLLRLFCSLLGPCNKDRSLPAEEEEEGGGGAAQNSI